MGLLNHLFGGKKGIAKELVMDDNKRMALWDEHLSNHLRREELSKHFNFKNVDSALQDFEATERVLRQIEALISPELVNIADEEKTDKEILDDLDTLKSDPEIDSLSEEVVSVKQKQESLRKLFHEIFHVLKAELHLIKLIRKNPPNLRDLLIRLFKLIFIKEVRLYEVFREKYFFEGRKHIHANIVRIARAILLEEEIKEEIETDEEKFAREMVEKMAQDESRNNYRKLGEAIFLKLSKVAGAPISPKEETDALLKLIRRMDELMKSDEIMYKIVKSLRSKYDDTKTKVVILAFREAFTLGHFVDLEHELYDKYAS